ncbi:MAG: hypothetical protein PVJ30_03335 [Thiohalocapsa sp.]|jgi:hypothetical protein
MLNAILPLVLGLTAFSISAAEAPPVDRSLEPCMNGGVSASGAFPTQAMEDEIKAYAAWSGSIGQPYYLFQVAGEAFAAAYPER